MSCADRIRKSNVTVENALKNVVDMEEPTLEDLVQCYGGVSEVTSDSENSDSDVTAHSSIQAKKTYGR